MNYTEKLSKASELQRQAYELKTEADNEKRTEIAKGDIKGWVDYEFVSSSGLTEEFAQFSRQMKRHLKKVMQGYEMLSYSRGHFDFHAFFKNESTDKIVYVSSSDVRHFSNSWYNNLLIRTAKHDKDWTGGSNFSTPLPDIKDNADYLTDK